jgi:hypothetical protein
MGSRTDPRCQYAAMTFEEIAVATGISQTKVQQLYIDGMRKLAQNREAFAGIFALIEARDSERRSMSHVPWLQASTRTDQ